MVDDSSGIPVGTLSDLITAKGSAGVTLVRMAAVYSEKNRATIQAYAANTVVPIARLTWTIQVDEPRIDSATGESIAVGRVEGVFTEERDRRRGVARALYESALQLAASKGWPANIDHNDQLTHDAVPGLRPSADSFQSYATATSLQPQR